jgi:hypothetical protein
MASAPKNQTTETKPWKGAEEYVLQNYKDYKAALDKGMPKQWEGDTVADLSKNTLDSQKMLQDYVTNGKNTSALTDASKTVQNIANGKAIDQTGNNALQNLLGGVNVGKNPSTAGVSNIANGVNNGKAPGTSTINQGMNWNDPALTASKNLAGSLNNNYTNPGVAATQNAAKGITGSYTNPGVSATQNALNAINPNYTNAAVGQAANYNNYTNAAMGNQQQLANSLQNTNNPAMANLQATASGANIGKNPYLDQAVGNATQKIADQLGNVTNPTLNSQAAGVGRLGSNASASLLNSAQASAADAMGRVATDMYQNQYNTDTQNMLNANQQVGNFYNSDVQNRLSANSDFANTSNSQQQNRMQGTQLYGSLTDSQQNLRNDALNMRLNGAAQLGDQSLKQQSMNNELDNMRLNAANQLGNQSATQQGLRNDQTGLMLNANNQWSDQATNQNQQRLAAANSANDQYQFDKDYQMQGLNLQNQQYQQGVQNQFTNAGLKQDAANSLNSNQNAQLQQQLAAAGMSVDMFTNGLLPQQLLAQLGGQQDQRAQDILNNDIQRYDQSQRQPLQNIVDFNNLLTNGNYNATTTPVYNNTGGQILGGLTSLLGLFASDERIKKVGAFKGFIPNGIAVYEWTYKDDPEQRVFEGPLAQDVEAVLPDAVVEFAGVKHIVMDRLLEAA